MPETTLNDTRTLFYRFDGFIKIELDRLDFVWQNFTITIRRVIGCIGNVAPPYPIPYCES